MALLSMILALVNVLFVILIHSVQHCSKTGVEFSLRNNLNVS